MQTFKPSALAMYTTVVYDRGQFDQPSGPTAVPGQVVDRRNPLYKTQAEDVTAMAHFMAHRNPAVRPSFYEHEVIPGGACVYFNGAEKKLVPFGPSDWPPQWGAHRGVHYQDTPWRNTRPTTGAVLSFPSDAQFQGHNHPVNPSSRR